MGDFKYFNVLKNCLIFINCYLNYLFDFFFLIVIIFNFFRFYGENNVVLDFFFYYKLF